MMLKFYGARMLIGRWCNLVPATSPVLAEFGLEQC